MKGKIAVKSLFDQYEWSILSALLLLALGIHYYCTFGGLIWTSDSFHYWAASRSFQSDKPFSAWDGGAYVYWPPLFPMILSFFNETTYHLIHASCLLASLFFIYLFFKQLHQKHLVLISLAIFILSVYPYLISSFLWSETFFTFLLFSGLYYYERWSQSKNTKYNLVISSILLAFMCLQRNAGVFIMVGLSIFCFTNFIKDRNWKVWGKLTLVNFMIVSPNIFWNNYQKIFKPEDYDLSEHYLFADIIPNLKLFSLEIISFFIPIEEYLPSWMILTFGLLIISLVFLHRFSSFPSIIFLSYLILFLILPPLESSEIGRFLSPIFPFIILQFVLLSKKVLSKVHSRQIKVITSALLALVLLYNIARTTKNAAQWNYRSIHHPKSAKIFF
jgi:hypothetical protein